MIRKICLLLLFNVALVQGEPITQLSESPRIFFLKDFLSEKECDYIIKLAHPNLIASQVVDEQNTGGAECLRRGGQRVASVIMYLNTPESGGETIFPKAKISITPKKGDAVLFYNCTPSGIVDPNSLHGGAPVKRGEKWIMTKWIRERAFY